MKPVSQEPQPEPVPQGTRRMILVAVLLEAAVLVPLLLYLMLR
jgi:hypothetical protein